MQQRAIAKFASGILVLFVLSLVSLAHAAENLAERPFEDLEARSNRFADEMGRLKEAGQTVPPKDLVEQISADKNYRVAMPEVSGEKLEPETLYARCRPGVVAVGGIYKCGKCQHWHASCSSGFAVHKDGLILTNRHVVEGFQKLEAAGVMTDDGRVLPVKEVLASNRTNDLVLLKVDADDLHPLPIAKDIAVGAKVYCLAHPVLSEGKINCFYAFTPGMVSGKFTVYDEKRQPLKELAITADYGPGSSGGPLLDERGAVVGMACRAIPMIKMDQKKEIVPMVWKFARPSCDMLLLLNPPEAVRETAESANRE
jgi:S1-C subfamily serine protease